MGRSRGRAKLPGPAPIGYWISADRWHYGMFGAFSVMMSANGTSEHLRRGVERATGTALGAVVGVSIASTFDGHLVLTYLASFLTVGIAFQFQRPSDTLSTFALSVMVTMSYVQMNTYQDTFRWDRVTETAYGRSRRRHRVARRVPGVSHQDRPVGHRRLVHGARRVPRPCDRLAHRHHGPHVDAG